MVGLVAERDRPLLVLTNRFQHLAERRIDGPEDHQKAEQETADDDVVENGRLREVENAEQMTLRDALDAVLAMGERRLQIDEVEGLPKRPRDHGKINALAPDRNRAGYNGKRCRTRGADHNAKFGGNAP